MRKKNTNKVISENVLCAEYDAVYHYILTLCRNDSEAQDITQETFLKAIKSIDKFDGNSSLYTWLCAIAKNLWINNCKKNQREISFENITEMNMDAYKSLEQKVFEKDMALYVHKVLHNMQEPYKEVFSLRVFGQLSFSEIADLFSKTESWARVTYHRARKMIGDKMRKDGYYE